MFCGRAGSFVLGFRPATFLVFWFVGVLVLFLWRGWVVFGGVRLWLLVVLVCVVCCCVPVGVGALPVGRVYELVSPVYKGGYGATSVTAVAPLGGRVVFGSVGAFAGDPFDDLTTNYYVADRGSGGWSTAGVAVPATVAASSGVIDFSSGLGSALSEATLGSSVGGSEYGGTEDEFLSHDLGLPDTETGFEVVGASFKTLVGEKGTYLSASGDFSHVYFESYAEDSLVPEAKGTASRLYDLGTGGAGGCSSLQLVGLDDKHGVIEPTCPASLGTAGGALKPTAFDAVAGDGARVFFTTGVGGKCASQVFVRVDDSRTVEVSRSLPPLVSACPEVPCLDATGRAPAEFQGANESGTLVYFTTTQPLVAGDVDTSRNLYMARIGCTTGGEECEPSQVGVTSIVRVSQDTEPANVQNVVTVAPDGSHVYFVARGVLTSGSNIEGHAPVRGADNLYVYDSATEGPPVFVGDLCSGHDASGEAEDIACPLEGSQSDTKLWTSEEPEAQVNVCSQPTSECVGDNETGRFLVFSSYAQLTPDDFDSAKDVYRYDSTTGILSRVSVGEDGYDANGNNSLFGATIARNELNPPFYQQHDMDSRAISENGSRIIFTSAEPLSLAASNGLTKAYEWDETTEGGGGVSLVSTGNPDQPVEDAVMSATGTEIFFVTTQGLVPQDTDGQSDVYDARLDGGFPSIPAPVEPCSGDACQGPLTNPAPLLIPGSVSQAPGDNITPPSKKTTVKKKTVAKKKSKPKTKKKTKTKGKTKGKSSALSDL